MINPEDNIAPDDANYADNDDQQSQQDIHSNGFDDKDLPLDEDNADQVEQADEASTPSFTLDVDRGIPTEAESDKE